MRTGEFSDCQAIIRQKRRLLDLYVKGLSKRDGASFSERVRGLVSTHVDTKTLACFAFINALCRGAKVGKLKKIVQDADALQHGRLGDIAHQIISWMSVSDILVKANKRLRSNNEASMLGGESKSSSPDEDKVSTPASVIHSNAHTLFDKKIGIQVTSNPPSSSLITESVLSNEVSCGDIPSADADSSSVYGDVSMPRQGCCVIS